MIQVTYGKGFAVTPKAERIDRLEVEICKMPQANCPIREYFANGLYAREVTIPKGVALIGAVHKTHNFAVLNKGILRLVTDDGFKDLHAGDMVQVLPGQKNCGYAIEECVWTNFHANPTNEKDGERLAVIFTESKASDLLGGSTNKQLAANRLAELEN